MRHAARLAVSATFLCVSSAASAQAPVLVKELAAPAIDTLVAAEGRLVFRAPRAGAAGEAFDAIWVSDGTASGTVRLADVAALGDSVHAFTSPGGVCFDTTLVASEAVGVGVASPSTAIPCGIPGLTRAGAPVVASVEPFTHALVFSTVLGAGAASSARYAATLPYPETWGLPFAEGLLAADRLGPPVAFQGDVVFSAQTTLRGAHLWRLPQADALGSSSATAPRRARRG